MIRQPTVKETREGTKMWQCDLCGLWHPVKKGNKIDALLILDGDDSKWHCALCAGHI